jgi:hypothetical protein
MFIFFILIAEKFFHNECKDNTFFYELYAGEEKVINNKKTEK